MDQKKEKAKGSDERPAAKEEAADWRASNLFDWTLVMEGGAVNDRGGSTPHRSGMFFGPAEHRLSEFAIAACDF